MERESAALKLRVEGDLTIRTASTVLESVKSLRAGRGGEVVLDFSGAGQIDSFGAAALAAAWKDLKSRGANLVLKGLRPETRKFLALVDFDGIAAADSRPEAERLPLVEAVGGAAIALVRGARSLAEIASDAFYWAFVAPLRGHPVKADLVAQQLVRGGVRAIPISCLIAFLVGLIMAMQAAHTLEQFGATNYIANMVGVSMTRELGPFLTAVVLAARSGSAITAEIGTMVVTEEIDAMKTMGLSPYRFLVVPRVLALALAAPCLTIIFDLVGILGGFVVPVFALGTPAGVYFDQTVRSLYLSDIVTGLVKSVGFGVEIALIACLTGFGITGGAEGVGVATTRSVVRALVLVIALDLVFTAIFYFG